MGPNPHTITPDLDLMTHVGLKPANASLGTYAMQSDCETCRRPIVCRRWPLDPWKHTTADELAELGGDDAE
jgi:hypothetical protein